MAAIGFKLTLEELKYHTPSRAVGISYDKERRLRRDSCVFIAALGTECDIGQLAIATASVYFHVFYAKLDFRSYDRHVICATALFLAGKVEERGKRVSEICRSFFNVLRRPKGRAEYERLRSKIFEFELMMMDVIDYNFNVTHPYKYLMTYLKNVFGPNYANRAEEWEKALKEKGGLAQTAWFFVNDSLRSTLCLQYQPEDVAIAVMFLTFCHFRHKGIVIEKHPSVRQRQLEETKAKAAAAFEDAKRKALAQGKQPPTEWPAPKPPPDLPWHEELFGKSRAVLEEMANMILQVLQSTHQENEARRESVKKMKLRQQQLQHAKNPHQKSRSQHANPPRGKAFEQQPSNSSQRIHKHHGGAPEHKRTHSKDGRNAAGQGHKGNQGSENNNSKHSSDGSNRNTGSSGSSCCPRARQDCREDKRLSGGWARLWSLLEPYRRSTTDLAQLCAALSARHKEEQQTGGGESQWVVIAKQHGWDGKSFQDLTQAKGFIEGVRVQVERERNRHHRGHGGRNDINGHSAPRPARPHHGPRGEFIRQIIPSNTELIVDLVCGDGVESLCIATMMQKVSRGFSVLGLDFNDSCLEIAAQRAMREGVVGLTFDTINVLDDSAVASIHVHTAGKKTFYYLLGNAIDTNPDYPKALANISKAMKAGERLLVKSHDAAKLKRGVEEPSPRNIKNGFDTKSKLFLPKNIVSEVCSCSNETLRHTMTRFDDLDLYCLFEKRDSEREKLKAGTTIGRKRTKSNELVETENDRAKKRKVASEEPLATVGLIGGAESQTQAYYETINKEVCKARGALESARILMYNFCNKERGAEQMLEAARTLENAGADCLAICSNTTNGATSLSSINLKAKVLHIGDSTGRYLQNNGIEKVFFLGTTYPTKDGHIAKFLESKYGLTVVLPSASESQKIHNIIYNELCYNKVTSKSREVIRAIMHQAHENYHVECYIIGCTELPLLVDESFNGMNIIEMTHLHALHCADFVLGKP